MRFAQLILVLVVFSGISLGQETNFAAGPQYLSITGATMLRPIATPTISLETPLPAIPELPQIGPPVVEQPPYVANPMLEHQADLFPIYYGYPPIPVIELSETESTPELPPSITGIGLTSFADMQTLRAGETVGGAAAYWKSHKSAATHVYTNTDIQRMPRS
jgi:hypothetical protein